MKITFELTADDYWHYILYYRRKYVIRPFFQYLGMSFLILIFLISLWLMVDSGLKHGRIEWTLLISLTGLLVILARIFPPTKGKVIKLAQKQPGLLCEHTISICSDWLCERTPVNEDKCSWATVISIEEDKDFLYLYLNKVGVHIIPKRAFASHAEAQTFLDETRRLWEAAKSGQTISTNNDGIWPPPPRIGA